MRYRSAFLVVLLFVLPGFALPCAVYAGLPGDRDREREPVPRSRAFALDLALETAPAFRNGLGLAITFDSREVIFERFELLEPKGLLGKSSKAEPDVLDVDDDEHLDSLVRLAWFLPGGGWEVPGEEITLGRAVFRLRTPRPPIAWAESPVVRITSLSAGRKGWFPDHRVALVKPQQRVLLAEEVAVRTPKTYGAASAEGAALEGVGNSNGSRPFALGRFQAHRRREPPSLTGILLPCNLDIDGNSVRDALTDGLLLHRYLFGFTGTALISDAFGTGATRTTPEAIMAFLDQPDCQPMLDVDANSSPDALTDGLLAVRYLFGFSNDSLVSGAVGAGAKRTSGRTVSDFLEFCDDPREVVIETSLAPGQSAQDVWGEIQVTAIDTPAAATVVVGVNNAGERTVEVRSTPPATLRLSLPDPDETLPPVEGYRATRSLKTNYADYHEWGTTDRQWFGGSWFWNRLPPSKQREMNLSCIGPLGGGDRFASGQRGSSRLRSLCEEHANPACYEGKEAVLFVHGFFQGGGLGVGGGEDGTFLKFPELVAAQGYASFVFEWDTEARFQDVATDLGTAILRIASATGRKVHIVGHSMGGIVARTILQGLASSDPSFQSYPRGLVRTLTTLGTPHSGIADERICLHNVGLPGGQDGNEMEGCQQLSCHELGESVLDGCEPAFFEVSATEGEMAAMLSNTAGSLPDVDILALLGWTIEGEPNKFAAGDELISYEGQRFLPGLTVSGTCPTVQPKVFDPLLTSSSLGNARVTERGLLVGNPIPGNLTGFACVEECDTWKECADNEKGYSHSLKVIYNLRDAVRSEAAVESTDHDSFIQVKNWLASYPAGIASAVVPRFSMSIVARDGAASTVLAGVTVTVRDFSHAKLAEGITGPDGVAAISVPFLANVDYHVSLWKAGYFGNSVDFRAGGVPAPVSLGTRSLWSRELGDIGGRVTDSATGQGLGNAMYELRRVGKGGSFDYLHFWTDASGDYLLQNLPAGRYQAKFSKSGYKSLETEFVIMPGPSNLGNAALTPINGSEEITIPLPGLPAGAKPLVLVRIPAGTFQMGSPEGERSRRTNEGPAHEVTLSSDYYLGKYEVTQAQWQAVMGAPMPTDCPNYGQGYGIGNDYPVYCLSWNDAAGPGGFLEHLQTITGLTALRLPTEAEWERAARGGTQTRFSFGDALECDDACNRCELPELYTRWCWSGVYGSAPVGSQAANPYGLHDMHGNVNEWVQDFYGEYSAAPETDPHGPPSGSLRVSRDGSWHDMLGEARSSYRDGWTPTGRGYLEGFRIAKSPGAEDSSLSVSAHPASAHLSAGVSRTVESRSDGLIVSISEHTADSAISTGRKP